MKIAVDLRSLQSGTVSGVENYTLNLLEHLLPMDKINSYTLFYNAFKTLNLGDFDYINARTVKTGWPNKLLNLALRLNLVSLSGLVGETDLLFMPNLNTMNLNTRAKIVVVVHDLSPIITPEFYDIKRRIWHKFLNIKKMLQRANLILAVSNHTKADLVRLYNLSPDKIRVIYPGVNLENFKPDVSLESLRSVRNKYELPGEYFLFLNTIEPRKNLIGTIKAFELADTNAHLVVAGKKGWKTGGIFKAMQNSRKRDKIHYLGYIIEEDKPALIKMAKALLYPSFYEGFGFQALEAMAIGTPVISSQVTSLPEVAGNASLLINPYNILDIKKAMEGMGNQAFSDSFSKKGEERALNFSWEKCAKETLEAINSLR